MGSTVSGMSAEQYMARFDVLREVPKSERQYTFTEHLEAGADGRIDGPEMNRSEPARALQALSDEDFAEVWAQLTPKAQHLYFFHAYPELKEFSRSGLNLRDFSYFTRGQLKTDDDRAALLRCITNERDLAYFLKVTPWVSHSSLGDDFGIEALFGTPKDKKIDARLRQQAEGMLKGGAVSPNGPSLAPPKTRK